MARRCTGEGARAGKVSGSQTGLHAVGRSHQVTAAGTRIQTEEPMPAPAVTARCYYIYAIELDPEVQGVTRFRNENPNLDPAKPCFYVGMTGKTPEERFQQHKAGVRSSWWARTFGVGLRQELTTLFGENGTFGTREEAEKGEVLLAATLRAFGCGVWQN